MLVLGDENVPIMSKEKREIYRRKIASFWLDFSHNKIGLIGLVILLFYIFMAVFAPYLSPYPAIGTPKAAAQYAMPTWMKLFPQYSNLPPTIPIPLNVTNAMEPYPEIDLDALSRAVISYNSLNGVGENYTYKFIVAFNYTYDQPREFQIRFKWQASFENVSYRIEINMTNPNGDSFILLGQTYNIATQHVEALNTYWNMPYGDWLTTSADVELTRRMNYERLYSEFYPIFYNIALMEIGEESYYNSTRSAQSSLYNKTVGNLEGFDEYFEAFFYGNDTWSGWYATYGNKTYLSHYYSMLYAWQAAFGNATGYYDYFQKYWYGNDTWSGYWYDVAIFQFEKEKIKFADQAAKNADLMAKSKADQASRRISPVNEIFVGPGEYRLEICVLVTPLSSNAALEITIDPSSEFKVWGSVHGFLGADHQGRDVLTQVLGGAGISLVVGSLAALFATVLEVVFGVASGYLGGLVDETIMRIVDILLCLPTLPLLLALSAYFRPNVYFIILIIAIFGWQGGARVVRSRVLTLREMPFVESARASGASDLYIIFRHLIPNIFPIVMASMVLSVPAAVITEAALSFLGFGDPLAPTWGKMLHEAQEVGAFSSLAWWYILPPGFAITFLCLAFVFIGHALDEVVNPRLRRRR